MISIAALFDELYSLGVIKTANQGISTSEVQDAMRRLKDLEHNKPTSGQLLRGAGVGAVAGPVAAGISKMVAGGPRKGFIGAARDIAGHAASGAVYGGAIPYARHHLETNAEKQRLKEYLGQTSRGRLRGQVKKTLGV